MRAGADDTPWTAGPWSSPGGRKTRRGRAAADLSPGAVTQILRIPLLKDVATEWCCLQSLITTTSVYLHVLLEISSLMKPGGMPENTPTAPTVSLR